MAQRHWAQGTLVSFLMLRTAAGLLRLSVADNSFGSGVVSSFSPWSVRPSSRPVVLEHANHVERKLRQLRLFRLSIFSAVLIVLSSCVPFLPTS